MLQLQREDWKNDSLWTDIGNWELEDTSDINRLTYIGIYSAADKLDSFYNVVMQ